MIHAKAALLIEDDIVDTRIACADQHLLLIAAACLRDQPRDELLAETLPLKLRPDGKLHNLARIVAPLHGRHPGQLIALVHAIHGIHEMG